MGNAEVVKVHTLVREQAAQAVEDLKAVEMWLQIKTPEVADGNNFGVEVQAFVAGELKKMRTEMLGMVDGMSAYHLQRGATVEKETKVAVEGDKTTNSSSKTTKTSASESAPLPDYVKYVAALDAKEYHACYSKLVDVRNTYVMANLAMTKNGKKLNDPRGEGDGSGHNYSSMF